MGVGDSLNGAFVRDHSDEPALSAKPAAEMLEVGAEVRMLADPRLDRLRALSERLVEKADLEVHR